jgi:nitroreductase
MDVFDTVRTLLAVRSYQDVRVPGEVVHRILEAGRLTASASNKQPWHFVVVQDPETIQRLGEAMPRNAPYVAGAPLAIVIVVEKTRFSEMDAARAIQSMLLTAWSEGVGGNWTGGPSTLEPVKPILGIPEEMEAVAVLPFGYPADHVGQGRKNRKPLAEVAHRERWDQPYT